MVLDCNFLDTSRYRTAIREYGMRSYVSRVSAIVVVVGLGVGFSGCSQETGDITVETTVPTTTSTVDRINNRPANDGLVDNSSNSRPNILLITIDDLGYTDLGVFGGEIGTPNLDRLARTGTLLTNFHTASTCSPTRSMLFSGTDNHLAGLGNMAEERRANQEGKPGYEGHLNFRVAALSELLQDSGYQTYMTGKWHLGLTKGTSPAARGFDKSYALLEGGAGHFDSLGLGPQPATYREDGEIVELPEDFYSTRFFAEKMIEYIDRGADDEQPFFAFLSFSAVHWPLQAPPESIARFAGRYDEGYDALYASRMRALEQLGLIEEGLDVVPRKSGEKSWDALNVEDKNYQARMMEIYAAMLNDVDIYVGKLIDTLSANGQLENTAVFVMSDNGAEGHYLDEDPFFEDWIKECCDNSYENMGKADSYLFYGPNWARASVGPFAKYKGYSTQGGIRVPAFVTLPGTVVQAVHGAFISVMDVMPTLLEIAQVEHPGTRYKGRDIYPMKGVSMLPTLRGQTRNTHGAGYSMGWELFGRRAMREGDWKANYEPKPYGDNIWRLYNLAEDPGEVHNLAAQHPDKLETLIERWDEYADENGVVLQTEFSPY